MIPRSRLPAAGEDCPVEAPLLALRSILFPLSRHMPRSRRVMLCRFGVPGKHCCLLAWIPAFAGMTGGGGYPPIHKSQTNKDEVGFVIRTGASISPCSGSYCSETPSPCQKTIDEMGRFDRIKTLKFVATYRLPKCGLVFDNDRSLRGAVGRIDRPGAEFKPAMCADCSRFPSAPIPQARIIRIYQIKHECCGQSVAVAAV